MTREPAGNTLFRSTLSGHVPNMLIDDLYDRELLARELSLSSDGDNPTPEEIHEIVRRSLRFAVVGISRDQSKAARQVPSYLAAKGAEIVPVNPNADRILGKDSWDSLTEVPGKVDMVVVFRPGGEQAGAVIRQAMERPERPYIWLQEGIRSDHIAAEARAAGWVVVQDLCLYKVHRALGDTLRRAEGRDQDTADS